MLGLLWSVLGVPGIKFTFLFGTLEARQAGEGVEMGHIREITLKKGGTRFQADINLNDASLT